MRYLSVCSGIEAASVAWKPLGWQAAGYSEIERFPRAVLEQQLGAVAVDWDHRHSPSSNLLPLFGDFTHIEEHHVGPVDLLVGGTPCQSFSIAGKRLGLDDPRGNLSIHFLALAERLRARWLVWENVPGVLSSWSGEAPEPGDDDGDGWSAEFDETGDFHAFLDLFRQCGYRGCYRVLDAQYVRVAGADGSGFPRAVPQRRRRVFVVGYRGDAAHAIPVLFDPDSLRGHPSPRRETGKDIAPTLSARPSGGGGLGTDFDCDGGLIPSGTAAPFRPFGADGGGGPAGDECQNLVAHTLRGEGFDASEDGSGKGTPIVPVDVAGTLLAETYNCGGRGRAKGATVGHFLAVDVAAADQAGPFAFSSKDDGQGLSSEVSPTLRAMGGERPNGGGQMAIAIQERAVSENMDAGPQGAGFQADIGYTLEARNKVQSVAYGPESEPEIIGQICTANQGSGGNLASLPADAPHQTLTRDGQPNAVAFDGGQSQWAVRRLMPHECERLQGFPDDWTRIAWRGRNASDCPDGPRYKAIGNSMAVNVMRWIGMRIDLVERACAAAEVGEG